MTLVQAWVDSVSLLKPKNLYLFALVTLKSIVSLYKVLLKYWWWLYALIIASYIVFFHYPSESFTVSQMHTFLQVHKLYWFCLSLLPTVITLSTRPSLKQKNCAYFRRYFMYCLPIIVIDTFSPIRVDFSPLFLTLFFFLDSDKQLKQWLFSLLKAIKMIVYNWPLFLIVDLLSFWAFKLFLDFQGGHWIILWAFLLPIFICIYMNIYIKKLHDQFDLYFSQPK